MKKLITNNSPLVLAWGPDPTSALHMRHYSSTVAGEHRGRRVSVYTSIRIHIMLYFQGQHISTVITEVRTEANMFTSSCRVERAIWCLFLIALANLAIHP